MNRSIPSFYVVLVSLALFTPVRAADLTLKQWVLDEAEPGLDEQIYQRKSCAHIWSEIRRLHANSYSHHPDFWNNPIAQAAGPAGITFSGLAYLGYAVAKTMDSKRSFKQARIAHRLTSLRTLSAQKNCFVH